MDRRGRTGGRSAPSRQGLVAPHPLTTLRFSSDTVDSKDPTGAEAAKHMRTFRLTTFAGQTLTVALGRVPEVKKLKAPVADKDALAALAKTTDAKPDPGRRRARVRRDARGSCVCGDLELGPEGARE